MVQPLAGISMQVKLSMIVIFRIEITFSTNLQVIYMIVYDEFSLEKERNYVVFSARAISIIEPNESLVMRSLPTHWYEVLCKKIDFELYDQYSVCIHERVHGFYNRLTDYKGVWILSNLPRGMADYFYDVKQGRVYWGAIKICTGQRLGCRKESEAERQAGAPERRRCICRCYPP